jgi:hypothetical protein
LAHTYRFDEDGAVTPALVAVSARLTDRRATVEGALRPAAEREVQTALSVGGYAFVLESYAVRVGAPVRAGEPLARLASPHAAIRLGQETSMLHLLEAQLSDARRAALAPRNGAEDASLGVRAAEQRIEQQRATLETLRRLAAGVTVESPIDGVVANLPSIAGASGVVTIARVVALDPLELAVALPLGARVPARGERVEVRAGPIACDGCVRGLAPMADASGRALLVIEVSNPGARVPAGLRVEASLDVGARRAFFLPESAVVRGPDGSSVLLADGVRRAVRVLGASAGEVEVDDVVEGEWVVANAASYLCAQMDARTGSREDDPGG